MRDWMVPKNRNATRYFFLCVLCALCGKIMRILQLISPLEANAVYLVPAPPYHSEDVRDGGVV